MAGFDNSNRPQYLLMWMWGIWTMVFLHNFGVSILLYKNRSQNASNFIKIIFNFVGLGKALLAISGFLVPDDITTSSCIALGYLQGFFGAFFRMSLSLFLLWRIKQIEFKKSDLCIGLILFAATSIIQLIRPFYLQFFTVFYLGTTFCSSAVYPPPIYDSLYYASISCDFAIDLFVTFRLIQILSRANDNARFVTSNMRRPFKRTLFTSVMYWNFIRLALSFIYQVITVIQFKTPIKESYIIPAVFTLVFMALSYVITADAEIVKVIEGRTSENEIRKANVSAENDSPPFKRFGFRRGPTSTTTIKESTSYIISAPSFNMVSSQETEHIDTNHAASSMKRLSFFEWAKFVVGKKDKNEINNSGGEDSVEEIEEKFPNNTDLECGTKEETRRESDHSFATTVIDSTTTSSKKNYV